MLSVSFIAAPCNTLTKKAIYDAQIENPPLKDPSKMGQWTLRLTVGEDIYFIPVVAIANTNTDVFSDEAAEWLVGSEIVPRGGEEEWHCGQG
ncbi:MAG: hypothetical protein Q4F99_02225 [bacterium]|nr:hypothetical protein [bacterium]